MKTSNALEIIKNRINENPSLKKAYLKEERNYRIACKIRKYRKDCGLTQQELAKLIDTKQSVISRIENADYEGHSLGILKKIALALNLELEDLLREKPQKKQKSTQIKLPADLADWFKADPAAIELTRKTMQKRNSI